MRLSLLALVFLVASAAVARADDTQPPIIRHTPVSKAMKGDAVSVSADMEDESEIFAPTLYFRYPGAKNYSSIPMTKKGGSTYVATVQATADVEYWIEAYDEFGNGPAREGSPDRPHKVTVAEKTVSRPTVVAARPEPKPEPPPPPPAAAEPEPESVVLDAPPPAPLPEPPAFTEPTVITEDPKPIYREWWFIGGGVAVTAAVVTVAVIALQPAPVYRNTFSASFKRPAAP